MTNLPQLKNMGKYLGYSCIWRMENISVLTGGTTCLLKSLEGLRKLREVWIAPTIGGDPPAELSFCKFVDGFKNQS